MHTQTVNKYIYTRNSQYKRKQHKKHVKYYVLNKYTAKLLYKNLQEKSITPGIQFKNYSKLKSLKYFLTAIQ